MSKKNTKQETIDEDVSFSNSKTSFKNISSAAEKFNSPVNTKKDHSKQQGYERGVRIQLHKDTLAIFFKLRKKYELAIFNENYKTVDQKHFFVAIIDFYINKLIKEGLYNEAPETFIASVTKKGRRRKTERSCSAENREDIFFGVSSKSYKDYFDIMYSFIKNDETLDPRVFSTSYFFYDLVDFTKKNIKEIIELSLNKIRNEQS
ncbi:hypothetical protein HN014_22155 (plasmid) [Aquimarina sp. TRL1]|uniref:hypothetical protein n=1 Tax=Aquimarina sp. (strain TRL1) TaxID=2736252 RepID=UPI001589E167|nr:hypothetical protein [Aquimarina sp. TRL1]QKX07705.1 hypothetical protein HN014_22155 [Aquimarina sp. TRL1]